MDVNIKWHTTRPGAAGTNLPVKLQDFAEPLYGLVFVYVKIEDVA